jgi:TolB-like protein
MPSGERVGYIVLLVAAMGALAYLLYPSIGGFDEDRPRDSIAVLPFADLSEDGDGEYFSDGMSEELLNLLVKVPNLRVAARTSSFAYKGEQVDVRDVARALGVDTVLEGSVRKSGARVRITAQLIDAETGYHLWSDTYDRELKDIFAVQDEISAEIVKALKVTLGGSDEETPALAREAPTSNVEAYQFYLQARHQWKRRGEEPIEKSIDLFEQALALDPEFARAYAGLAAAYVVLPGYAGQGPEETAEYVGKAANAARQALARDPNLGEAHAVLAQIDNDAGNWVDAEAAFFFATAMDPDDPTTHHWHSILLRNTGRLEASLEAAMTAFDLDPASPVINNNLAQVYVHLGYDEQALRYARSAVELGLSNDQGNSVELLTAFRSNDMDRIIEFNRANPQSTGGLSDDFLRLIGAVREDESRWPELRAKIEAEDFPIPEPGRFTLYLFMGRPKLALEIALKYVESDDLNLDPSVLWSLEGTPLRRLPGFSQLVEKLGLVDYWKQYGWPDDCRPVGEAIQCGFTELRAAG